MKRAMKAIVIALCIAFVLGSIMTAVDFCRLRYGAFEPPIFTTETYLADGGSTRLCRGLFHKIVIKGNFMPEDEFPGITHYTFYIFGIKVDEGIRD